MKNENSVKALGGAPARVRILAILAILAAFSVVLGKFLQIPIGDSIRISFENLPTIFAGIVFGPLCGAAVGAVADLVGCLAVGYAINPIITLGAAAVGITAGITARFTLREQKYGVARILPAVLSAHIIGSILIKSAGLRLAYMTPWSVLAVRIPTYLMITAAETAIICILLKSEAIRSALKGFGRR